MDLPGTSNFHPIPCRNFYGVDTEEELGGDESDVGCNVDPEEEIRDDGERDTDTEQSDDENEDDFASDSSTSEDDIPLLYRECYNGKDKTKWKKTEPTQSIRTRRQNIVTHLPGTKGAARQADTPLKAWQCFFTDELLQTIVEYTNIYIGIIKDNFQRDRDAKTTNLEEIKALFGLLYYAGVLKSSHLHTDELWSDNGTGIQIFRCGMSQQRFRFLLRALRFDDKRDRAARIAVDKLAPLREVFDFIVLKCKQNFSVAEYTTIDEMLWGFRGRCSFRQYMRNKPAKYGLKVFSIVDARSFYVLNMEFYLGKQPPGPHQISQAPDEVVKRLITPISGSGRNVTYDNWFTSVPLAHHLLQQHNLTTVGTIRKNKPQLPPCFIKSKDREVSSSVFGFEKNGTTLVSYVPKKGKFVLLLSTMHHGKTIDPDSGDAQKPEIIIFYNCTKGGVDIVDEMCGTYSTARKTNRWPLSAFFHLLDVVGVNSFVISSCNKKEGQRLMRRTWLKELAKELVSPYMRSRLQIANLPKCIRTNISQILQEDEPAAAVEEQAEEGPRKRKRCKLCSRTGNKSFHTCASCKIYICGNHGKLTCLNCLKNTP